MNRTLHGLKERYVAALQGYLEGAQETALLRAYELGREAIDEGAGLLDMARAHEEALGEVLLGLPSPEEWARAVGDASDLFAESLAPFEMAHRGFREANDTLRALNRKLEEQIHQLAQERNRTAAVLASIGEGLVITDAEGLVVAINPAMERLAGWREEEVTGRPAVEIYPTFDARGRRIPPEERVLARALESRAIVASHGFELVLETRAGHRIPVGVTAAPVLDPEAGPLGGVVVVRDVSHEREVDHLKSSLIALVSHELRTPLTMILGFAEILLARDVEKQQSREFLERIHDAAARLSRLIDDLLSVSRIESGGLMPKTTSVDLPQVVKEVATSFAHRRDVQVDLGTEVPPVLADRDMLLQILTNLVSNAIKYSGAGQLVAVRVRRRDSSMEIAVEDQGIGMTEAEVGRLFEKFYRVDRPEVREAGGSGLGLYITKSLIGMMGGQIWVESEPGKGTTLFFSLPLAVRVEEEEEEDLR